MISLINDVLSFTTHLPSIITDFTLSAPCNNNLSAFTEMRLAALIQKPLHGPGVMDAQTVFDLATIEGAKALHL
ncbi:MAG: amidohydrolase family protein, partial [Ignavibacteriaceae bacterium]